MIPGHVCIICADDEVGAGAGYSTSEAPSNLKRLDTN